MKKCRFHLFPFVHWDLCLEVVFPPQLQGADSYSRPLFPSRPESSTGTSRRPDGTITSWKARFTSTAPMTQANQELHEQPLQEYCLQEGGRVHRTHRSRAKRGEPQNICWWRSNVYSQLTQKKNGHTHTPHFKGLLQWDLWVSRSPGSFLLVCITQILQ